jgi:hypothetical protein
MARYDFGRLRRSERLFRLSINLQNLTDRRYFESGNTPNVNFPARQLTSGASLLMAFGLNYRTVWRWHFYAGLICIPFVLWLAVTGSIYLFRPQIEAWLDRPYEHLTTSGPRASAASQVEAALAAVPDSKLHYYQLPRTPKSAVQIIVGRGTQEFRVYVNPFTLQVLKVINEDHRLMERIFYLHGELVLGDRGSFIVETAASWAIIMILTGLYLWWPRSRYRTPGCSLSSTSPGRADFLAGHPCRHRHLDLVSGPVISLQWSAVGEELGHLSRRGAKDYQPGHRSH